jgi:hypothetical protein
VRTAPVYNPRSGEFFGGTPRDVRWIWEAGAFNLRPPFSGIPGPPTLRGDFE